MCCGVWGVRSSSYQWRKALAFDPVEEDRKKIENKLVTGLEAMPEIAPETLTGGTEI